MSLRIINNICDLALLVEFCLKDSEIDIDTIRKVIKDSLYSSCPASQICRRNVVKLDASDSADHEGNVIGVLGHQFLMRTNRFKAVFSQEKDTIDARQ